MKFKVGDRVVHYDTAYHIDGRFKDVGIVIDINAEGRLKLKNKNAEWYAHPKQCRRLKPKRKAREFWLEIHAESSQIWTKWPGVDGPDVIHVREVLKKKE